MLLGIEWDGVVIEWDGEVLGVVRGVEAMDVWPLGVSKFLTPLRESGVMFGPRNRPSERCGDVIGVPSPKFFHLHDDAHGAKHLPM